MLPTISRKRGATVKLYNIHRTQCHGFQRVLISSCKEIPSLKEKERSVFSSKTPQNYQTERKEYITESGPRF